MKSRHQMFYRTHASIPDQKSGLTHLIGTDIFDGCPNLKVGI